VLLAVLVKEQRADAAARDDDVARTTVLELVRIGHALLRGLDVHVEDATDLVVVGLDEKRVGLDGLHEELARGIDHELDAPATQAVHNLVVHGLGERTGNGTGEHEGVTRVDDVHAL